MPTIEINSTDEQIDLSLTEILALVEPFADHLAWYCIEFEPVLLVGDDGTKNTHPPVWASSLWREIQKSAGGIKLEWQTLKAFARFVVQTDMALIVGLDHETKLPAEPFDLNGPEFVVVVQCLDPGMWAMTSHHLDPMSLV